MQPRLGWSVQALWAGAEDVGVSAAAVGILPRGEAMLVEWHEHCCTAAVTRRLTDEQPLLSDLPEPERIQVRHWVRARARARVRVRVRVRAKAKVRVTLWTALVDHGTPQHAEKRRARVPNRLWDIRER